MVFLVPFDDTTRARVALETAVSFARDRGAPVLAVSYVPAGGDYAERRRWVDPEDSFATDTVAQDLHRKIAETTDETERTYADSGAHAPPGGFSADLRRTVRDVGADVVFVGTAADGSIEVPLDEEDFDVYVVRSGAAG